MELTRGDISKLAVNELEAGDHLLQVLVGVPLDVVGVRALQHPLVAARSLGGSVKQTARLRHLETQTTFGHHPEGEG